MANVPGTKKATVPGRCQHFSLRQATAEKGFVSGKKNERVVLCGRKSAALGGAASKGPGIVFNHFLGHADGERRGLDRVRG